MSSQRPQQFNTTPGFNTPEVSAAPSFSEAGHPYFLKASRHV